MCLHQTLWPFSSKTSLESCMRGDPFLARNVDGIWHVCWLFLSCHLLFCLLFPMVAQKKLCQIPSSCLVTFLARKESPFVFRSLTSGKTCDSPSSESHCGESLQFGADSVCKLWAIVSSNLSVLVRWVPGGSPSSCHTTVEQDTRILAILTFEWTCFMTFASALLHS